jgi:hypothetical protein
MQAMKARSPLRTVCLPLVFSLSLCASACRHADQARGDGRPSDAELNKLQREALDSGFREKPPPPEPRKERPPTPARPDPDGNLPWWKKGVTPSSPEEHAPTVDREKIERTSHFRASESWEPAPLSEAIRLRRPEPLTSEIE